MRNSANTKCCRQGTCRRPSARSSIRWAGPRSRRCRRAPAQSGYVMRTISRRQALALLTGGPVAAAIVWTPAEAAQAHEHATQARAQATATATTYKRRFFTAQEYATVGVLVDLIIPK